MSLLEQLGVNQKNSASYHSELIKKMEPRMTELFRQMKSVIDPTDYDLVIGDEFSGRIPTYISLRVLRELNGDGFPFGVLFKPEENVPSAEKLVSKLDINYEYVKKALFVTEYVSSGRKMRRIKRDLGELGIRFDVLCLESHPDVSKDDIRRMGEVDDATNIFYVERELHEEPILISYKYNLLGFPTRLDKQDSYTLKEDERLPQAKETKSDLVTISNTILNKVFDISDPRYLSRYKA